MNQAKTLLRRLLHQLNLKVYDVRRIPCGMLLSADVGREMPIPSINTVFDVGANIGQAALHYAEYFPFATIHSFEPVPDTFEILRNRTSRLPQIKCHNLALGNKEGTAEIALQAQSDLNSLLTSVNQPDPRAGNKKVTVEVSTVDLFSGRNGIEWIHLLKTDTEGFDLQVLEGARRMIADGRVQFILSEVGFDPANTRNTEFTRLQEALRDHGYKLRGFYNQSTNGRHHIVYADALFQLQRPVPRPCFESRFVDTGR